MKAKEVLQLLKVSRITLMNYVKNGTIQAHKLPNGTYDYDDESIHRFLKNGHKYNAIYSRVSTKKQKRDLKNQVRYIQKYCDSNEIDVGKIYSDISSGADLDRKDFSKLLDDVMHYKVKCVYISFKDRLSRSSFSTIKQIFDKFKTNIVIISEEDDEGNKHDPKEELLEDIISLLHVYSMTTYSKRQDKINK